MKDIFNEDGINLTKAIEGSTIEYQTGQEIIGCLHALDDWHKFGDALIKEFGFEWYRERAERAEQTEPTPETDNREE